MRERNGRPQKGENHLRSLIRASNVSPSFSTYILSLLLRASRIWGSMSGVWSAMSVVFSVSGKFRTPLRSEAKGDVDCASMLSMDVEVSIEDGGDNDGEVILGKVEAVARETDS